MKFIKLIFSWKLWLNSVIASGIVFGISYYVSDWLKHYTKFGEEIEIPLIKNLEIIKAIKLLEELGLEYEIDSFKYDSRYKPFQIFQVYPEEGSQVKKGRKIFIRCNPKTWQPIALPNLLYKSKYVAFSQINMLGLKVGDILYETNLAQDRILRVLYKEKVIKAGEFIPKYAKIDLVIGRGLEKDVVVPNIIGLDYFTAKKILKQNYFEEGLIKFEGEKDTLNARIYYQEPIPGSKLDQGLSVNIWLSTYNIEKLHAQISQLDQLYDPKISIDTFRQLKQNVKIEKKIPYHSNIDENLNQSDLSK